MVPPAWVVRARRFRAVAASRHEEWLAEGLGSGRGGEVLVRPIRREDAEAWMRAMRANHDRMGRWWSLGSDPERVADRIAFEEHLRQWTLRLRRGTGACLALVGPAGLIGELHLWHLRRGGRTCEIGLWLAPDQPREVTRGAAAGLGFVFDRLFDVLDLGRIDAPVAVANPLPRPFLRLGGFAHDATIPQWREVQGELVDYDLFGLTAQRWAAARPGAWRTMGPWQAL